MSAGHGSIRAADWPAYTAGAAITQFPPTVGYYCLPGLNLGLTAKPSRWHRLWVRVFLGWTWRDA